MKSFRSPLSETQNPLFNRQIVLKSGTPAFQEETAGYFVDYIPGNSTAIITFESAGAKRVRPDGDRDSWGQKFLRGEGLSIIAVKPKAVDWYRGRDIHAFFEAPEFSLFCRQFKKVLFYGSSMGGYAAIAFSKVVDGAIVLAHVPQSTLSPALVPWEKRFLEARKLDWTGAFHDAAESIPYARSVYITYDPFYGPDRRHFERMVGPNVHPLKLPLVGHNTAASLLQMGMLKRVVTSVINEETNFFPALARARRNVPGYYVVMAGRAKNASVSELCLKHALDLDPKNSTVHYKAFNAQYEAQQYEKCLKTYEMFGSTRGIKNQIKLPLMAMVSICHVRLGNNKQAKRLLGQIWDRYTEDPGFYKLVAQACLELDDFETLEKVAAKASLLARRRLEAWQQRRRSRLMTSERHDGE